MLPHQCRTNRNEEKPAAVCLPSNPSCRIEFSLPLFGGEPRSSKTSKRRPQQVQPTSIHISVQQNRITWPVSDTLRPPDAHFPHACFPGCWNRPTKRPANSRAVSPGVLATSPSALGSKDANSTVYFPNAGCPVSPSSIEQWIVTQRRMRCALAAADREWGLGRATTTGASAVRPRRIVVPCADWREQPGLPRVTRGSTSIRHIPIGPGQAVSGQAGRRLARLARTPALTTLRCHRYHHCLTGHPPPPPCPCPAMRSIVGQYLPTPTHRSPYERQLSRKGRGRHEIALFSPLASILYAMLCNGGYLRPTYRCLHCVQRSASTSTSTSLPFSSVLSIIPR
ncbi:hypothetical protein B0T14DRAFT_100092 [Immersiella caudata]|uniref:Uncharacterized protein n=1 Tax=Immersiella caudata TaxID=314043 RepID=A0AA39X3T3_9PEZI|nr:hypothetical protein B0T14DRAFT_100092 [Immersiella caudata]